VRPTAIRTLKALRDDGGQTVEQLAARLAKKGRAVRPATVQRALEELAEAGLVAPARDLQIARWSPLPTPRDPLLDAVDLHGSHDFRHTFATWLEDDGIPARVIDELMGHEATDRGGRGLGSAMGAHYRHTTPEMAARVITAIDARLAVVLSVAEGALETRRTRLSISTF
jgi:DNA-binding transcriptional ArsR family regulator